MIERLTDYLIRDVNPDFTLTEEDLRVVMGSSDRPPTVVDEAVSEYLTAIERAMRVVRYWLMGVVGVVTATLIVVVTLTILRMVTPRG